MTNKNWLLVAFVAVLASVYVFWFSDWFQPKKISIYTFTGRKETSTATSRQNTSTASGRQNNFTARGRQGTSAALGRQARLAEATPPLNFVLNRPLKLTMIKVVPLDEFKTNRNTLPVWHVVSSSNTPPMKMFSYGQNLPSMKPFVPGTRPESLATNVTYRLFIEAGDVRDEHDFHLK